MLVIRSCRSAQASPLRPLLGLQCSPYPERYAICTHLSTWCLPSQVDCTSLTQRSTSSWSQPLLKFHQLIPSLFFHFQRISAQSNSGWRYTGQVATENYIRHQKGYCLSNTSSEVCLRMVVHAGLSPEHIECCKICCFGQPATNRAFNISHAFIRGAVALHLDLSQMQLACSSLAVCWP